LRESSLTGYNIPEIMERIIVTLFADDTTVYLAREDDWATLESILSTWCMASGAKFNIEKTVIIPIGSVTHRQQVVTSRSLGENGPTVPITATIIKDKSSTRALGAQIGNGVDHKLVWTEIIRKTSLVLDSISKLNPPIQGIRMGAQTYGVSRTQYQIAADGIPPAIEKTLESVFRKFFWQGKKSKINMDTLKLPLNEGGQNWVDFTKRTDAIALMMLKSFLGVDGPQPKWAKVARSLMRKVRKTAYKDIPEAVLIDPIIQTWETSPTKLPQDLQRMLKVASKYGLVLDALSISTELKLSMPAFLH
ncbi:hypothetical protein CYLTODRAFT_314412, partial [Cylindrobasidium torrendii FP15055 ss-10]